MEGIEPISPTAPAIAPIDATHVKVRGTRREGEDDARDRREEARRREEAKRRAVADEDDDERGDDRPHIDLRV
jgi:hypothetical protein